MAEKKLVADWVHLPVGVQAESLWTTLHDARLYFAGSDRIARTATLRFEIFYLDDNVTVTFNLEEVTSLRVTRAAVWPGEYERPEGISRSDESKLIAEYHSKWREESMGWGELEALLGSNNLDASDDEKDYLDISNADFVQSGAEVALHIQGFLLSADLWHELYLRGSRHHVVSSDGSILSLEHLTELGQSWWNGFGKEAAH